MTDELNKEVVLLQFKHIKEKLEEIVDLQKQIFGRHRELEDKVDEIDKKRILCSRDVDGLVKDKKKVLTLSEETSLWRWMQRKPSRLFVFIIVENLAGLWFLYEYYLK